MTLTESYFFHGMHMKDPELITDFYVYVHEDRISGSPFYVGKGRRQRAYETKRRPERWKKHVASLLDDFVVQIVSKNLTEDQAYQLEHKLIAKYGKISEGTGPLINITDGGEHEGSVAELSFDFISDGDDEDSDPITFKLLRGQERDTFAKNMIISLEALEATMEPFLYEDEPPEPIEFIASCIVNPLTDLVHKFLRRRVACVDMAYQLKACKEDLNWIGDEVRDYKEQDFSQLFTNTTAAVNQFCQELGLESCDPDGMAEY
jgi:hypothetical protein